MKKTGFFLVLSLIIFRGYTQTGGFFLNQLEYFENEGVNVMAFQDIYPEGHQGGVAVIMHGMRIATNGDIRLDETPGQWQPIPKQLKREANFTGNLIKTTLTYPDSAINRRGFNPIIYPDLHFNYIVTVKADGPSVVVTADLDRPVPEEFIGKVSFNLELFPGWLFGKSWIMDGRSGIFPRQPDGPGMTDKKGELVANKPLASGKQFVLAPEDDRLRMAIRSNTGDLQLLDGRYIHNNGWFVLRSVVAPGVTKGAVEWVITPHAIPGWISEPVIHVSQVGYHPDQEKIALVELDSRDNERKTIELIRVRENGDQEIVMAENQVEWGKFLRYNYVKFDFSKAAETGMYCIRYGDLTSQPFRIAPDVYERHVWQPTLEYFLPVQMCHMRINEKYRVWHGLCHMDDARMAPLDHNHFDGYIQGSSTLTKYQPGEHVPGLNTGGWHDAGDYDLRVESQSGEVYILCRMYEAFQVMLDETTIDQVSRIVEIHQPDGKPDILQQIEHGALSVVAGYQNLGRLYRGIICPTLRQYVLLGDGTTMTDGLIHNSKLKPGKHTATHSAPADDRWVFTEENPSRELTVAAHLAAASRALKGYNDPLCAQCLSIAETIYRQTGQAEGRILPSKIHAAAELLATTGQQEYRDFILRNASQTVKEFSSLGPVIGHHLAQIDDAAFTELMKKAAGAHALEIEKQGKETPFGVPYRPRIWGAGWDIQSFGVRLYELHKAFPDIFPAAYVFNAMNFVLGVHPGSNTASFASGVGSRSATVAYGVNRADWSYIPGGVVSGTALIRPDFPELLDWPFLWQQQEYVMGGGATNFMFLVLAANELLSE